MRFIQYFMLQFLLLIVLIFPSCSEQKAPWNQHGALKVVEGSRYLEHEDGTPFLWMGCTAWGMTEWLTREDVDLYLDDRLSKGMNVVQLCLFWGKRQDYPTQFTVNPTNPYGHRAFIEVDGIPDAKQRAILPGGSPENPNDYWDHVDYCLSAIRKRGMYAAVLPFWGRRYVNATHTDHSLQVFSKDNIKSYGVFLGKRYGQHPNIIWVNGGDVKADEGGDYVSVYRMFAEGLAEGVSGEKPGFDETHPAWDSVLMTYHPSGHAMFNSSAWFHNDIWLDFNMIETHLHRNELPAAIRQDIALKPVKPTVMGEGHYEGKTGNKIAKPIHIRRQAYLTFFCGASGHTYGGGFDADGNGPLFSPANNWKPLLNWQGAIQMKYLRDFLEKHQWWAWKPLENVAESGQAEGELEVVGVRSGKGVLIYFPENRTCRLKLESGKNISWFQPATGRVEQAGIKNSNSYQPPNGWEDAVLIIE